MPKEKSPTSTEVVTTTIEGFLELARERGLTEVVLIGSNANGFEYRYQGGAYHAIGLMNVVAADIKDGFRPKGAGTPGV